MSDPALASIIISSHNYATFLPDCIDSALGQTYRRTEVVVVDDASTDDSRDIILSYGNRISAVFRDTNAGENSTVNAAGELARGEFVTFLDSDDTISPVAIERAMRLFEDPEVVKVHWPLQNVDSCGHEIRGTRPDVPLPDGDFRGELAHYGPFRHAAPPTSGNAYSKRFLESVLPVPDGAFDDAFLAMWALASGRVKRLEEPHGCYRVHGRNAYEHSSFDRRLERDLRHAGLCTELLSRHYRDQGVMVNLELWKEEAWFYKVFASVEEIKQVVPEGETFLLADADTWASRGSVAGRKCLPFPEREGQYGGKPTDGDSAIREIERQRQLGARALVVAWPVFWWLEHYGDFRTYLQSRFSCVLRNERVVVFDLRDVP